jgi:predicted transcriptional regulator
MNKGRDKCTMDIIEDYMKESNEPTFTVKQLVEKLDIPSSRINKACNGLVARNVLDQTQTSYFSRCRIYHLKAKMQVLGPLVSNTC